jgi:hypothetical protein
MMGFITARVAVLAEADPADRRLMRLDSPALDREPVVYLLTIGTVPTLQRKVLTCLMLTCHTEGCSHGLHGRSPGGPQQI